MTILLHTSDTHLGYHQYHLQERAADFAAAFEQVIDNAIDLDVDGVIHSGDLFHDSNPRIGPLLHAIRQLRRLQAADIPFLTVAGNHDSTRDEQWVSVFTEVADAVHLDYEPTVLGDVAVYGQDHVSPSRREQLEYDFERHNVEHAVLVAHGAFEPLGPPAEWSLPRLRSSSTSGFDVALLGDDHTPVYEDVGGTFATYPGSTERTATDQRTERGYTIVQFGADARTGDEREDRDDVCPAGVSYDRSPLDTRPHEYVDIEATEDQDIDTAVQAELRERALEDAVVAVRIIGEGDPVTVGPLEELAHELGALVARVSDRRQRGSDRVAIDVSFADPEDAVERRRQTLGLSTVVDELEQQVRTKTPVDANLKEEVKTDIETRIDEDPGSFAPMEPERTEEELREQAGTIGNTNSGSEPTSGTEPAESDGSEAPDESVPADTEPVGNDASSVPASEPADEEDDSKGDGSTATDTTADKQVGLDDY
jgi:DNA repair exonuclease SbcCD nuclease subunit